uniref:Amino acid transporter n=1 Tax=Chelonoidis abingdonii TaxID=106734 RepID=A0A8C0GUP5_CHEAB
MSDQRGHVNSLFLNEGSAKRLRSNSRVQRFQQAVQERAARAKKRMHSITKDSAKGFLRRNAFVLFTITAVLLGREHYPVSLLIPYFSGIILAFALRPYKMTYRQIKYFSFPGELLMRMLQMLVLPLIVSSLVTGEGPFLVLAAVCILQAMQHPATALPASDPALAGKIEQVQTTDAFMDLVRTILHSSNVTAGSTANSQASMPENVTGTLENVTRTLRSLQEVLMNALGLVVFSVCFGLVIGSMKQKGRALQEFFSCLNEAIMRLVAIIIWYAPVGILFLIAGKILEMDDLAVMGGQLGMYTLTVIVGLLIHSLCVLPLLYFIVTHKNPWVFIAGLLQALITALGTSSSSATLPITFRCLEENNGVDRRVTRFVLPVGATINMDGTALYEALAAIFIAQVNNFELDFGTCAAGRDITATAASIGAAGIPQAGLVTMMIVLTSVGLPTEDITLIIAVDWFLDRLRTTTNVLGDSLGAGIVEHLSRHELDAQDSELGNSVIEENEKPYHLIYQANTHKHRSSETIM